MPMSHKYRLIKADIMALMADRYPLVFVPLEKGIPKPLKKGILEDILTACPDVDRKHIGFFLATYTSSLRYLRSMTEGAARIGLDGEPGENVVTQAEADHAMHRMNMMKKRWAEERKAKREEAARRIGREEAVGS